MDVENHYATAKGKGNFHNLDFLLFERCYSNDSRDRLSTQVDRWSNMCVVVVVKR